MALTLALVSFSCTGPLIGTLLVNAIDENLEQDDDGAVLLAARFGHALAQ